MIFYVPAELLTYLTAVLNITTRHITFPIMKDAHMKDLLELYVQVNIFSSHNNVNRVYHCNGNNFVYTILSANFYCTVHSV